MKGGMAIIRKTYGVPAKRGGRIMYRPNAPAFRLMGTICSSDGAHLMVRMDHSREIIRFHPTWEIQYFK